LRGPSGCLAGIYDRFSKIISKGDRPATIAATNIEVTAGLVVAVVAVEYKVARLVAHSMYTDSGTMELNGLINIPIPAPAAVITNKY